MHSFKQCKMLAFVSMRRAASLAAHKSMATLTWSSLWATTCGDLPRVVILRLSNREMLKLVIRMRSRSSTRLSMLLCTTGYAVHSDCLSRRWRSMWAKPDACGRRYRSLRSNPELGKQVSSKLDSRARNRGRRLRPRSLFTVPMLGEYIRDCVLWHE